MSWNSRVTSSLSLRVPKKPEYGLMPNPVWVSVALPRYWPSPGAVTCSRAGCVLPLRVTVPSTAPPLKPEPEPAGMTRVEAKVAVADPRIAAHLLLDLPAVAVGEREGAAGPLADLERAEVEVGADRGGGRAAVFLGGHLDLRRPPGDLDGEVVTGPGGQAGPGGLDDDTPGVGPEPEIT